MQGNEKRKRRCALDSDSPEEFMKINQLAELVQNSMNVYYDDRKIMEVRKLKSVMKKTSDSNEQSKQEEEMVKIQFNFNKFQGFDHNFDQNSPGIQYIDPKELPPLIELQKSINSSYSGSYDEIVSFNIMIIGQITDDFRQFVTTFCKVESRKNSDEFEPDIISPMKWQHYWLFQYLKQQIMFGYCCEEGIMWEEQTQRDQILDARFFNNKLRCNNQWQQLV